MMLAPPLAPHILLAALLLGAPLFLLPTAHAQTGAGKTPLTITANELTVQNAQGTAAFSGNVKVVRGDLTLTAAKLEARYQQEVLQDLTATGGVTILRGQAGQQETAKGDRATFNPATETLTLTGTTVTLSRGPSTLTGDKLVYNLNTQEARVTNQGGPVQATFTPGGN